MAFDLTKLKKIVESFELRKSLEIINLQDEQGYTLLHSSTYYNTYKIAEYLIGFIRERLE